MKIEVWSDYACPFCYIGERRLKKAIEQLDAQDAITVEFKSFELDPYAGRECESVTIERFATKYGLTEEEAARRVESISEMGRGEGIDFRYATTRYTNTFDSLRVTKLAQAKGKTEIVEKFFDAYFTKNLELSDPSVMKKIAVDCGLDPVEVDDVINSDKYAQDVRDDEREAAEYGIHSVPYFVINQKYSLSGAQPTEVIRDALKEILDKERERTAFEKLDGMSCGPNGCRFDG